MEASNGDKWLECFISCYFFPWLLFTFVAWAFNKFGIMTGMVIGSIFTIFAFMSAYERLFRPGIKRVKKSKHTKPEIVKGFLSWLAPAIALQLVILIGFLITVDLSPLRGKVYTHPIMLGQMYIKMNQVIGQNQITDKNKLDDHIQFRRAVAEDLFAFYKASGINSTSSELPQNTDKVGDYIEKTIIFTLKIPYLTALAFGFLGTLVYTLRDMAHRYFSSDLFPKTYIRYLIRFIFVPVFSLVVAYYLAQDWRSDWGPIIFFSFGLFPQTAVNYIEGKFLSLVNIDKTKTIVDKVPLIKIQGVNDYVNFRFKEIGVNDAQNLATSDCLYLQRNLGFSDRRIVDYKAQAMLMVELNEDFETLQKFGIRNIVDYKNTLIDDRTCEAYSQAMGIKKEKLITVRKMIKDEHYISRIKTMEEIIKESIQREKIELDKQLMEDKPFKGKEDKEKDKSILFRNFRDVGHESALK